MKEVSTAKPRIFCFINSHAPENYYVLAMAEDGNVLGSHLSSSPMWARHDIGLDSEWKHDEYGKHYPNGYELEWVDNPRTHAGLQAAYALNQELGRKAKEGRA